MGYLNNLITAPVGIGDVSQALNNSSTDLGTLCSSVPQSKKWAKYKPEHWGVNGVSAPIGFLTDSQRQQNHYGLSWFPNMSNWITFIKACVKLQDNQVYKYNAITTSEPKRIADFLKFGNGSTPATSTYGFKNNAVGPVSSFNLDVDSPYPNPGSIDIAWATPDPNTLNFSDFVNINDNFYYGVLFLRCNTSNITEPSSNGVAYDILSVNPSSSSKQYGNYVTLVWHIEVDTQAGTRTPDDPYNPEDSSFGTAGIDAEDIHRAGLNPEPLGRNDTASYEYIYVPVLFRRGLINDFSAGYCIYPIEFGLNNDITNVRVLPVPISRSDATPPDGSPFIVTLSANGAESPELAVLLYQFEGTLTGNNISLTSATVYLRGAEEGQAGSSRLIRIEFYYSTDPIEDPEDRDSVYTTSDLSVNENVETSISITGWVAKSIIYDNKPLRYRIYVVDPETEEEEVGRYEDSTVMSRFSGGE